MSTYSFGDGILPPIKRKPASDMAQSSLSPAPLAGPMDSQHVAVLDGVQDEQQGAQVIDLGKIQQQRAQDMQFRIDSGFKDVRRQFSPDMAPAAARGTPAQQAQQRAQQTFQKREDSREAEAKAQSQQKSRPAPGASQEKPRPPPGSGQTKPRPGEEKKDEEPKDRIPCLSACDAVFIIEASRRNRGVTVNWLSRGGRAVALGKVQSQCAPVEFSAEQVRALVPQAQAVLNRLRPPPPLIKECIQRYCKKYGCDTRVKPAPPPRRPPPSEPGAGDRLRTTPAVDICILVFAIKAAQYGKPFTYTSKEGEKTLSPSELKQKAPEMAARLKSLLDSGRVSATTVADCERRYCEQYGCKLPTEETPPPPPPPPPSDTGGGGGGGGVSDCPEGTALDPATGQCVPVKGPEAEVETKKGGFGWLVAAGIAATLAKKVLFVTALAGAPKLVELEDEDDEDEDEE